MKPVFSIIKKLLPALLISLLTEGMIAQPEFTQHMVTGNFTKGADIIAVDLNQDEAMDIVAVNSHTSAEVAWWKNNGFNEFTKITIRGDLNKVRSVRAKDVNRDQHTDLVAAVYGENRIIYLENEGIETFIEYTVDDNFVGAHTIDIKDVNDDGKPDILCSGFDYYYHNGEIAWWENDGNTPITWTKHLISDRFQQSPFIFAHDMDGDDDMDIIACGELNDEILWWENDGDENFTEHMIDSLFDAAHTVIAKDVDLDGDTDILAAACISSQIAWYENNGSQVFTKHYLGYFAGALWLDATDLDNDGDNDLFGAAMGTSHIAWWENTGNQQFIKHDINGTFTQAFCVVPAMMDNDNDIDLVAIGWQSNKISWFENKLENPDPYNHPECCVYDYANDRWLVSNTGGSDPGYILEVDDEGNTAMFKSNIEDPLGMCIAENTLYVSDADNGVLGFDLATGEEVFFMSFNPIISMDGQAYDNNGHLFVVDTYGRIYKIYLEENFKTLFVSSGLTDYTQDIVFDEENNRLLAIGYAYHAPIQAIDLSDSTVTNYPTSFNNYDGITMDQRGHVYLASHQSPGRIIKYFSGLNGSYEVVSSGHNQPAGLHYNKQDNILAIPNYGGNSVDFIRMGAIIHVPDDYPTIQEGIDVAANGDTVLVDDGAYVENINFKGKNITVASHYLMDGDFSHISNTIINGNNPTGSDTASCILFCSGEDSTAVLCGFTLTQGAGTHWVDPQFPSYTWHSGGGIFIFQSSPTIRNNYIINNHVDDDTGVDGASGGGICMYGGNPFIINNVIKNNTALYGAGVVIDYSGCLFKNNLVVQNSGGQNYGGGGFWMIGNGGQPVVIENNTIVDNESETQGGAIYLWSTQLTARNNIIWNNSQATGEQIYLRSGASADITYSNVHGGYPGEGNIEMPPLFNDSCYLLLPASPCIDAGDPDDLYNDPKDSENPGQALWPAQGALRNDMGAYGGPLSCVMQTGITGIYDGELSEMKLELIIFPNPFSNFTRISVKGTNPGQNYVISINDMTGKVIRKFSRFHSDVESRWNGYDDNGFKVKPGIYLLRLISSQQIQTRKISVIR